jgi:hypothetical protein
MDPQLTKKLIRRRLILDNLLESSIINEKENKIKNTEKSSVLLVDNIISSNHTVKNNFLEKIKKFESFSENQVKITQQVVVEIPQNNFISVYKPNKQNTDSLLLKKTHNITKKLELDGPKNLYNYNKQNQNLLKTKKKKFESSLEQENNISKENSYNVKEHAQCKNKPPNTPITNISSKSDFNNWKIDSNWVFYTDYSHLNKTKIILNNKSSQKKKKNIGIIQIVKKFSRI